MRVENWIGFSSVELIGDPDEWFWWNGQWVQRMGREELESVSTFSSFNQCCWGQKLSGSWGRHGIRIGCLEMFVCGCECYNRKGQSDGAGEKGDHAGAVSPHRQEETGSRVRWRGCRTAGQSSCREDGQLWREATRVSESEGRGAGVFQGNFQLKGSRSGNSIPVGYFISFM